MKKGILSSLALAMLTSACYSNGMLKKKDYVEKAPEEIRSILLGYAPVGSRREKVEEVLRSTLKRNYKVVNYAVRLDPQIYASSIEEGDFTIRAYLESYGWARHFFLAGQFVEAFWLFSKDGILKDVQVLHSFDGV